MKRTIYITALCALLMSTHALAGPLMLSPGGEAYSGGACGSDCGPGQSEILAWLDANVVGFDSSLAMYKSDEDGDAVGTDSGEWADGYTTTFSNDIGDPADALISLDWDGGLATAQWLLVKDGNNAPVWYLFDISGWDGASDISLTGFWPGNGAISNVSIYAVPEPGTLALLGIGLLGMALASRRITA